MHPFETWRHTPVCLRTQTCESLNGFTHSKRMTIATFFRKIFSKMMVGNCLGMIVVTLLLIGAALLFINRYTRHGEEVEVPNICGDSEEVATRKLEALGLKAEVSDTGYVYRAAPYAVLEQSIKPGERVKPGRTVMLTINSDGPRKIALPDIAGNCSRREAEDKLKVLGFKLAATEYEHGQPLDWVCAVKVNGKSVKAGDRISVNSPITLVVGGGDVEEDYNGNDSLDYILNAPEDVPADGEAEAVED